MLILIRFNFFRCMLAQTLYFVPCNFDNFITGHRWMNIKWKITTQMHAVYIVPHNCHFSSKVTAQLLSSWVMHTHVKILHCNMLIHKSPQTLICFTCWCLGRVVYRLEITLPGQMWFLLCLLSTNHLTVCLYLLASVVGNLPSGRELYSARSGCQWCQY